ncbi:MAG: copper-translocating P-type ATPase [Herpetosiphonaceae bacterium]|nr:MAG: copper-translocating P-type ATPase [Herpetosiphonaceae bacterium]
MTMHNHHHDHERLEHIEERAEEPVDATTVHAHPEMADHAGHMEHSAAVFRRRFWIALLLTIPVVLYSELVQELLGYQAPAFPGSAWVEPVLSSIIYWYGGWVFLSGSVAELRRRLPGMMTLVSLAITTAYFYSLAVTFELVEGMPFYWELATLVTVMLFGHWMEMRAVDSAQSALKALARLLPDTAERIAGDRTEQVPAGELRPGDLVLVRPGGRVPADGTVEEGSSHVDESMITGESRPVDKTAGSDVIAGTVNGSGSLRVRVTRIGEETVLAGIMRLVREAQTSRTRAQALADRAAFWLTLVALGVALVTLIVWIAVRGFDNYTLERMISVLVVACPHALGLAIPLVVAISTTLSARNGILVRDRLALERARYLNVVVFDKTGTLTRGEHGVVDMLPAPGVDADRALALAAAVESDSEHMIARAIVAAARERDLQIPPAGDFQGLPGRGAQAVVKGRLLKVGSPRLVEEEAIIVHESLTLRSWEWSRRGQTVVFLAEQGRALAAFALADVIRPESYQAIATLKRQGIRVAMLTGDSTDVARWVAEELAIDEYFAEVLPEHKSAKIKELQADGSLVAMVGDGINDAPALAQADIGIAIGAGTDVALAAAHIVLVKNDPRDVVRVIALSKASYRKMLQNLGWAVAYNIVALPVAAGVLAPLGFVLPPAVAALLMALSTVIVAINTQTLRMAKLDRPAQQAQPVPAPA